MSFSVSFLCVCVCAHRSSATCDDLVCVCASCLFFRKTKSKRNGVDTSLLPPIFFFLPCSTEEVFFLFLSLSLYAIAVHHTQSFSACSIYNIAFSILSFEGCNLTLRSSGQAVLSVDAAIKKKTLCPGSAEFCCPHAAPPPLPAVVPVRMKALDALWSFSLSPLTSELMIALVGGGDVMLSCPLPQLHRTRVHGFSVFTPLG